MGYEASNIEVAFTSKMYLQSIVEDFEMTYQSPLWLYKRPILAIHLVVETAGVAEVVAIAVPSPQRGGGGATVHALTAF